MQNYNGKFHIDACILGYAVLQLPQLILVAYRNVKKFVLDNILQREHGTIRLIICGREPIRPDLPQNREGGDHQNNDPLVVESIENVNQLVLGPSLLGNNNKDSTSENEDETQLQKMISQLKVELNNKFEQIDRKFEQMDGKFEQIDKRWKPIE